MFMMSRTIWLSVISLITIHISYAVILRIKWYPYFPGQNQAPSDNKFRSNLAALTSEASSSRQVRTVENEDSPLCHDRLTNEECLKKILLLISRFLQNRKYL